MMGNLVITIGRECGSAGRLIGQKLAADLGVKCYDKELLTLAAKNSGLCEELFKTHDEKPTSSFLYSLVMDTYSLGYNTSAYMDMPINHKIFLAQFDTIKKLAEEESCVIVGRCGDYVLRSHPDLIDVFICADMEDRVRRIMDRYSFSERDAVNAIKSTDRRRKNYYENYTKRKWGSIESHQMLLNISKLGMDKTVRIIKGIYETP